MNDRCQYYRNHIPAAVIGELEVGILHPLLAHLRECPACSQEHTSMATMIASLGPHADVPVPRHFLIRSEMGLFSLRARFSWLITWPRWAWAAAVILVLLAATLRLSWPTGNSSSASPVVTQADLQTFRSSLLQTLEVRSKQEQIQWLALLRDEMQHFSLALDQRQRTQLRTTLARFEDRMGQNLSDLEYRQRKANSQSAAQIFDWLQTQQNAILQLSHQMDRVALYGEQRGAQTDADLAILFQAQAYQSQMER